MGLGPRYHIHDLDHGNKLIIVEKPDWAPGPKAQCEDDMPRVRLNPEQYRRFCKWREDICLIQSVLSDLTKEEREILQTGLSLAEQSRIFGQKDGGAA
jgi:hypothetical protein